MSPHFMMLISLFVAALSAGTAFVCFTFGMVLLGGVNAVMVVANLYFAAFWMRRLNQ